MKNCDWLEGKVELVRIATSPVGVPEPEEGATEVVIVTGEPCATLVLERCSVVAVGWNVIVFQSFTSTLASTEPKPLA